MNSSPLISLSAIPLAKNNQAAQPTGKVVPLPGARTEPVVNITYPGSRPKVITNIRRGIGYRQQRLRRASRQPALGRLEEMQALRDKLEASRLVNVEVRAKLAELDASTEEILFVLGH